MCKTDLIIETNITFIIVNKDAFNQRLTNDIKCLTQLEKLEYFLLVTIHPKLQRFGLDINTVYLDIFFSFQYSQSLVDSGRDLH